MQNIKTILLTFILLSILSGRVLGSKDNFDKQLIRADSLYKSENYTEALSLYEQLIEKHNKISLSALLKIAKIYEGLNDYSKTLCYLSWYKALSYDNKVDSKITQLADKHELFGYEYTDLSVIKYYITRYRIHISVLLAGITVLLFVVQIFRDKNLFYLVMIILFSVGTCLFIYLTGASKSGIIINDNSIIHEAPSAGGDKIEILNAGHKLKILDEKDIWYQVQFNGTTGWIRKNNLWKTNL